MKQIVPVKAIDPLYKIFLLIDFSGKSDTIFNLHWIVLVKRIGEMKFLGLKYLFEYRCAGIMMKRRSFW